MKIFRIENIRTISVAILKECSSTHCPLLTARCGCCVLSQRSTATVSAALSRRQAAVTVEEGDGHTMITILILTVKDPSPRSDKQGVSILLRHSGRTAQTSAPQASRLPQKVASERERRAGFGVHALLWDGGFDSRQRRESLGQCGHVASVGCVDEISMPKRVAEDHVEMMRNNGQALDARCESKAEGVVQEISQRQLVWVPDRILVLLIPLGLL